MSKSTKLLALPVIALVSGLAAAAPATIEVPRDFPTIQKAIDAAADGDMVLVAPGTYRENLTLDGKAITLASRFRTAGDEAVIKKTILDGGDGSFVIKVGSAVGVGTTIQGFTLIGSGEDTDGVRANGLFDFLDNRVTVTGDGIDYEDGSGGLVRSCVFEGNGDDGIDLDERVAAVIEHNIIRDNADDGIEIRLHDFPSGPDLQIVIRDNLIAGNDEDGIQLIDGDRVSSRVFLIERNRILDNKDAGLAMMADMESVENFEGTDLGELVVLANNTIVGNDYGVIGGDNLIVLNNIIAGSRKIGLKRARGQSIAAYNLFFDNGTDFSKSNVDLDHTVLEDSLLNADQTLKKGSPAIDAGVARYEREGQVLLDIPAGDFHGDKPDLGALESGPPTMSDGGELGQAPASSNAVP